MEWVDWSYWYIFPCALAVAITANASGFSGAVLFQPFFNIVLRLPIQQSIATGVATETIGMSSGAVRYGLMHKIDLRAAGRLLPAVVIGLGLGLVVLTMASRDVLKLVVGIVIGTIAITQLYQAGRRLYGTASRADLAALGRYSWLATLAGASSACTGTGVAEVHQPLLERLGGLATKRANATAIFIEAAADWLITSANLSLGNLRTDILIFSLPGVLIGAQLGAMWSRHLPDRTVKTAFALCVLGIGLFYIGTSLSKLA